MKRVSQVVGHLNGTAPHESAISHSDAAGKMAEKKDCDIVIVSAVRTAIGKAKKGAFKDTHPTDLLAACLKGVIDQSRVDPAIIGDIQVGNVLAVGGFATQARMAMFLAGFPKQVPITTCNRQCSSGLQAFANVAGAIRAGYYDIGIAAGVESMSKSDMMGAVGDLNEKVFENPLAAQCLNTMGQTSENVAERFNVPRKVQDELAVLSNVKALKAQAEGRFTEIIPVTTKVVGENGEEKVVTVTQDDGPRKTTYESLAKLKAAFKQGGTTTAGNSSQVSDGAAAVLLTTRRKAKELGLPIKGVFRSFAAVGVDPDVMGIGPAEAIPVALQKAGISVGDVGIYEINEAFASQAVYCIEALKIPLEKVNPNGGAIALGHPLGCTGARQIATLMAELKRSKQRYGVVSMCIGTGMGAAAVFEAEN
jgi:acetyl-CoA acyltransferase 1